MKEYTFFWLTGKREVMKGNSPVDCFQRYGFGAGAIGALDFYAEGDVDNYKWNSEKHTWESIK